ncbi:MAG: MFS transporter [Chloroflexi bacterium]|nr:MFS transporter [Chloroflexota bacterium]
MAKDLQPIDGADGAAAPGALDRSDIATAPFAARPVPSKTARWKATFSSLANRDFRYLWFGMMAMMGGVQMEMVAIGYLVYDITGSALLLGLVEAGFAIPTLVLALFGGALADRIDRKRVIQVGQGVAALVGVSLAVVILTGNIRWEHLMIAALIEGAMFAFLMPARQSIIPQLVEPEQFTNAMGINSAAFSSMTLVAPAVAGGLYALLGPGAVYVVITSLYVVSVVLTTQVRRVESVPVEGRRSVVADIKEGLGYVLGNRMIMTILAIGFFGSLLSWPFRMLLPIFVVDVYHLGPDAMGLMISVLGAGSLVGSLTIASLGRWRRGLLLILGTFVSALGLALVAAIPVYYAAVGIMVLLGLGEASRWTLSMTLIMERAEDRYRGRVSSVFMMNFGLMPLSVLPAGIAAEYLGGQVTIGIMAGLLAIVATAFLITQKRVRQLQ